MTGCIFNHGATVGDFNSLSIGHKEVDQGNATDGTNAEGGIYPVPYFGLPHEEPLSPNSDKADKPDKHGQGKTVDGRALLCFEDSRLMSAFEESPGTTPAENCSQGFCYNDSHIKDMVKCRGSNGSPHPLISWKGSVHRKHMLYKLVVGVVIKDVVEDYQAKKKVLMPR